LDEIELVWGGFTWVQWIHYWCVPFRFFGCHKVGHIQAQFQRNPSSFPSFQHTLRRKEIAEDHDMLAQKEEAKAKPKSDPSSVNFNDK
jgi:hypothetical protein